MRVLSIVVVLVALLIAIPLSSSYFAPKTHSISGKCAIVTGSSGGIGVTIADELAKQKVSKIILAARSLNKLEAVAASLRVKHPSITIVPVQTDVSDDGSRKNLLARADEVFGSECARILVNNAGVLGWKYFADVTDKDIETVLDINLKGLIHLTRLFMPQMIERDAGHVVNIASIAGKVGSPLQHLYTASKHGVVGFTKSLRSELRFIGSSVTMHVICPGFITDAGMATEFVSVDGFDEVMKITGTSTPQDSADAVVAAIEYNTPDMIVNASPLRWLVVAMEVAPKLMESLPQPECIKTFFSAFGANAKRT